MTIAAKRARARTGRPIFLVVAGAFCETLRLRACLAETTDYGIFMGTLRRPTPSFSLPNVDVYEESYADLGARFATYNSCRSS